MTDGIISFNPAPHWETGVRIAINTLPAGTTTAVLIRMSHEEFALALMGKPGAACKVEILGPRVAGGHDITDPA